MINSIYWWLSSLFRCLSIRKCTSFILINTSKNVCAHSTACYGLIHRIEIKLSMQIWLQWMYTIDVGNTYLILLTMIAANHKKKYMSLIRICICNKNKLSNYTIKNLVMQLHSIILSFHANYIIQTNALSPNWKFIDARSIITNHV